MSCSVNEVTDSPASLGVAPPQSGGVNQLRLPAAFQLAILLGPSNVI